MKNNKSIQNIFSCSSNYNIEGTLLHEGRQQVCFYHGEMRKCCRLEREFFRRKLDSNEWIDLAAAPKNALVFIGYLNNELFLDVIEPVQLGLVSAFRIFRSDHECQLRIESFHILREHCQRKGIGTECFYRQMKKCLELNISQLTIQTGRKNEENGYYTWPRFGFDAKLPPSIVRSLPSALERSQTLLKLMQTKAGRIWWRQHGIGLNLTFNLSPKSDSVRAFEKYYRLKQKKGCHD